MVIIIIMISIRWIYIFILFVLAYFFCLAFLLLLVHKKKVFICDGVMVAMFIVWRSDCGNIV